MNYYTTFPGENRLVLCVRWEISAWLASKKLFREATPLRIKGPAIDLIH
jgi:hypothetical protein